MHQMMVDFAHAFPGGMVLVSFLLLYQDRMSGLINAFAVHALVLALAVAWQAFLQDAPHLYVTALLALVFKGVVIRKARGGAGATFTVRKVSAGVGVERIFPLHSPRIEKIEVTARGHIRRSRLYYLRGLRGKKARLRERQRTTND